MSKFIRSQKKGKPSAYTCRFLKKRVELSSYPDLETLRNLKVESFFTMPKSNAVLIKAHYLGKDYYFPSPLKIAMGTTFNSEELFSVVVKPLKQFDIGTQVCNVERSRFGKFMFSAAGTYAKIVLKEATYVVLEREKRQIKVNSNYFAMKGKVCNSGASLKPFVKAGNKAKVMKAKGKKYPIVSAHKMNAQDHPLGGSYRKSRGKPMTCSRHSPPGRKTGSIAAKRTGRKKK